jgi:Clp amino terminal domain, pathogenicity island component
MDPSTTAPASINLEELISAITTAHPAALDQLSRAILMAQHLDTLADDLVGHFVDQARRSGASWTEIGCSMGVTKQAAQKRFTPKPDLDPSQGFSRFTDQAREVVVAAQAMARANGNSEIAIGHLLLGLVSTPGSRAVQALDYHHIGLDEIRTTARATLPPAADRLPKFIPFDAHTRAALELTFDVAARLGSQQIGTEHILLAVLEVEDGTGVLAGLGVTGAQVETFLSSDDQTHR